MMTWSPKNILRRFIDALIVPFVKYIVKMADLSDTQHFLAAREIDELRARIMAKTPDNPCAWGFKAFAQTDEDGIIQNILGRIPDHSRTFVEIGCGRGVENNTHFLALQGYKGYWIDGSAENIAFINDGLGGLRFDTLLVKQQFVSRENIGLIVKDFVDFFGSDDLGLFSLDIDGNELYVLEELLKHIKPLVLCVEYNAIFPPPVSVSIRYVPGFQWQSDDYAGASLQALCDLLLDYMLVSCNLSGANAFFVRRDAASAFTSYTPAELFQPGRDRLARLQSGNAATLKWLRDTTSQPRTSGIARPASHETSERLI